MTVNTTSNRDSSVADGVTSIFPFTFALQQAADLKVYHDGVLVTTGYTVSINSSGVGGNVVYSVLPANGITVLRYREVAYTQGTVLPIESALPETVLEQAYDKLTMMCQQLKELLGRSILLPITSTISNLSLPIPEALKVLRWNSAATALENVDLVINGAGVAGPATTAVGDIALFNNITGNLLKRLINGAAGTYLKSNGPGADPSWATGGDVSGPGTAVDYAIALANGTTGKIIRYLAAVGAAGQVLVSNGPGAAPSFQTSTSGGTTLTDSTLTAAGQLVLAHGLGAPPKSLSPQLVCQTAELGYSIGDVVGTGDFATYAALNGASSSGYAWTADNTNVTVRFCNSLAFQALYNKTTGIGTVITLANWKIRLTARL